MTRTADGDLLATLTGDDLSRAKAPRGATPVPGTHVRLWRLPGTWSVWSPGPDTGTWWLNPVDETARYVADTLADAPSRGLPDVTHVTVGRAATIAVRTKAIRPGGLR